MHTKEIIVPTSYVLKWKKTLQVKTLHLPNLSYFFLKIKEHHCYSYGFDI